MVLAALATVAGSAILNKVLGGKEGRGGTAADPNMYPNIRIPGASWQQGPTVDMPVYQGGINLPYDIPVLDASLAPATMGEQGQGRTLSQAEALTRMLLDPTNPMVERLAKQEQESAQNDFLTNLRSLMTTNQRAKSRGRAGLFDPERQDDDVMMAVLRNAADARIQGRQRAEQKIGDTAKNLSGLSTQYGSYAGTENTRRNAYREDLLNRLNQIRGDTKYRVENARQDQATTNEQQRNDILNAIKFARNANQDIGAAESEYRKNQALHQSNQLGSVVSTLFSAFGGGGNTGSLPGLPWKS